MSLCALGKECRRTADEQVEREEKTERHAYDNRRGLKTAQRQDHTVILIFFFSSFINEKKLFLKRESSLSNER